MKGAMVTAERFRQRLIVALVGGLLAVPTTARAILIETTPGTRVGGYFVRDDGKVLIMRIHSPDGNEKDVSYDKGKFKIIHQVDRGRLEKLAQDNPKTFYDYADELSKHGEDPEARDLAMRLFLIAAYLKPRELGAKSLVRMSLLAGTPAESRRCLAMAYLLDPNADESVLRARPAKAPQRKLDPGPLQDFLKALHFYRIGQLKAAKDFAARKDVDKIFAAAPGKLSPTAFVQRCNDAFCATCKSKGKAQCSECSGKGVTIGQFGQAQVCPRCKGQRIATCSACDGTGFSQTVIDEGSQPILRAELWGLDQLAGVDSGEERSQADARWSAVLQARQVSPVAPLSLETITEFDPRKCLYRNGVWVAP